MSEPETTHAMVERICRGAKAAATPLARAGTAAKNDALRGMARGLRAGAGYLQEENARDLSEGSARGLPAAMITDSASPTP